MKNRALVGVIFAFVLCTFAYAEGGSESLRIPVTREDLTAQELSQLEALEREDAALEAQEAVSAAASSKPLALVWRGPGVCQPACGISAAQVARRAGFRTLSVYPGFDDESKFAEARLWVQPGGKSVNAAAAIGPKLLERLRQFIAAGGGYVGYCAGMFMSTELIGTSGKVGLGVVAGRTELHFKDDPPSQMIPMRLPSGAFMEMYYAGGPDLTISPAELEAVGGEVTAFYSDGKIAGFNSNYGKGRVAVIGTHPEAGWFWKLFRGVIDPIGEAYFAMEMMNWAVRR